jgi:hypothetical protein
MTTQNAISLRAEEFFVERGLAECFGAYFCSIYGRPEAGRVFEQGEKCKQSRVFAG